MLQRYKSFLYRRISSIITCSINFSGGSIELYDKHQLASFQDVFTDPNYWRVFDLFEKHPELIVDCGAHCGHFSILCDLCLSARHGQSNAHYVLIEPNQTLQKKLVRNMTTAGLGDRFEVIIGAVGKKEGRACLARQSKNLLVSSVSEVGGGIAKGQLVQSTNYIDVNRVTSGRRIDLLKLDIEGSEFEFIKSNDDVISRTQNLVIEIHKNHGDAAELKSSILAKGFESLHPEISVGGNLHCIFRRS